MLAAAPEQWHGFINDMRSIFEGISISVDFDESTDENINVFFQFRGGPRLPVDAAGTSVLQASQILAYISLFRPQVLILDEPDSHLHPDNQRVLCDLVTRLASERGFQAIISTHSRHVLNSLKARASIVWLSRGSIVEGADINTTEVLLELGALDSLDYFADGETKCVIATEDTDKEALRALLASNGFVENDFEVSSYTGCTKVDAALVLGGFLKDKAPHVRLIVHRDRDYMSPQAAQSFEQKLAAVGIHPLLTDLNDVESYFVNAQHLHALNPVASVARIQEIIEQATTETSNRSIEALVNQRTIEAFKQRQLTGQQPNHGAIVVQATADYNSAPTEMRRGKLVIGRVIALLQQEIGTNPIVYAPSVHLCSAKLLDLATEVWPED
jgi:hypothetical protein